MERKKERKKERKTPDANEKMKNELPQVGFEPTTLCTPLLPTELPRQPSWQGPNRTSHAPV